MEYALDTSPTEVEGNRSSRLFASLVTIDDRDYLNLSFLRRSEAKDLAYIVESSDDLSAWEAVFHLEDGMLLDGHSRVRETGHANGVMVTVRDVVPMTTAKKRQMRLVVGLLE